MPATQIGLNWPESPGQHIWPGIPGQFLTRNKGQLTYKMVKIDPVWVIKFQEQYWVYKKKLNKFEIALNVAKLAAQTIKFMIKIDCLGTYNVE